MSIKSKEYLKSRFENGDIPDEVDFSDLIDAIFYTQWPEDGRFDVIDAVDVDYSPTNYQILTQDVSGHLHGIDNSIGSLSSTIDNIDLDIDLDIDLSGYAVLSADNDFTGNNTFKAVSADIYGVMEENLDVMIVEGFGEPIINGTYSLIGEYGGFPLYENEEGSQLGRLAAVGMGDIWEVLNDPSGVYYYGNTPDLSSPDMETNWEVYEIFHDPQTGTVTAGKKESLAFTPSGILDSDGNEIYVRTEPFGKLKERVTLVESALTANYFDPPSGNYVADFYITSALPNELTIDMNSDMNLHFDRNSFNYDDSVFGVLYVKTNNNTLSANPNTITDWFVVFDSFDPNEYETIVYHSSPGKPYAEIR